MWCGVWVSVSVCVPGSVTTLIPVAPISRKETKELHTVWRKGLAGPTRM